MVEERKDFGDLGINLSRLLLRIDNGSRLIGRGVNEEWEERLDSRLDLKQL